MENQNAETPQPPPPTPPMMEQKTVKFEIGKILAIVVVVVAIAGVASLFLGSTYFKGQLIHVPNEEEGALSALEEKNLPYDCNYLEQEDIRNRLKSPYLTSMEENILIHCKIYDPKLDDRNADEEVTTIIRKDGTIERIGEPVREPAEEPAEEAMAEEPAEEEMAEEPAEEEMAEEPAGEEMAEEPAGEEMVEEPAGEEMAEEPAAE